jgi:hypothetical protein
MTVAINSRYRALGVIDAPGADGVVRPTVPIRRLTPPPPPPARYRHLVTGVEDIEYLAWRFVGNGEDWWRIADDNPLAFPLDLRPGDRVDLPRSGRPPTEGRGRTF